MAQAVFADPIENHKAHPNRLTGKALFSQCPEKRFDFQRGDLPDAPVSEFLQHILRGLLVARLCIIADFLPLVSLPGLTDIPEGPTLRLFP